MTAAEAMKCPCPHCKHDHDGQTGDGHAPKLAAVPAPGPDTPLKLDLGCGKRKKEGFTGVDARKFDGVDVTCDLGRDPWPWPDDSVEEAHASHMVEHLPVKERIHFVNELHRVLRKGKGALIIVPSWKSCRAYGDLTHAWPPVTESWFFYLDAAWRAENAPHNDEYTCDFSHTYSYLTGPALVGRSAEYANFACAHYTEAALDLMATIVKK